MSEAAPPPSPAQPFATGARRRLGGLFSLLAVIGLLLPVAEGPALMAPRPLLALSDVQALVVDAWRLVNQSYVDPSRLEAVQWRKVRQKALEKSIVSSSQAYDAIEAMLEPIGDPYTRLMRPADFGSLQSNTRGTVSGVGLQLGLRASDQAIVVIAPLAGSPAAEAGIASGSELVSVNGRNSKELGLEATASTLSGDAGSEVIVTLIAPGNERPKETVLKRRQVDLQPVRPSRVIRDGHRLGVLRITQFSEQVPLQVRDALIAFSQAPAAQRPIEGLLLDLRNNSGGLVQAGLAVANNLLDAEAIVETQDRGGLSDRQVAAAGSLYAGPMLTLVNGGTASASEILAGALQDSGRSPLAGSRTYGKGLIQTLIPLGDGSGLAVTVARYLTPSGRDIQDLGIEPDLSLPEPEPLNPGGDDDSWLEQAEALLVQAIEAAAAP